MSSWGGEALVSRQMRSSTASPCKWRNKDWKNGYQYTYYYWCTKTREERHLRGSWGKKVYCHRYVLERIRLIRVTFEITIVKLEKWGQTSTTKEKSGKLIRNVTVFKNYWDIRGRNQDQKKAFVTFGRKIQIFEWDILEDFKTQCSRKRVE